MERLNPMPGLGVAGGPPGGADGSDWEEGCLGIPLETAAPGTRIRLSGRKRNETVWKIVYKFRTFRHVHAESRVQHAIGNFQNP